MHEFVYKCAMVIWKNITPRVLLDKLYTLMNMYIKSLKKLGGKVIMEILVTKVKITITTVKSG